VISSNAAEAAREYRFITFLLETSQDFLSFPIFVG